MKEHLVILVSREKEVYKDLKVLKENVANKGIQEFLVVKAHKDCPEKMVLLEPQGLLEKQDQQVLLASQELRDHQELMVLMGYLE